MKTGEVIFLTNLRNAGVFDPYGDRLGTVVDVVLIQREKYIVSVGVVVQVGNHRLVFLPFNRIKNISQGQVTISGVLNISRFSQRPIEKLQFKDIVGHLVKYENKETVKLLDLSISLSKSGDWIVNSAYIAFRGARSKRFLGLVHKTTKEVVDANKINFKKLFVMTSVDKIVAQSEDKKPVEIADELLEMPINKQVAIAKDMDRKQLALVLEEMNEDNQIKILSYFPMEEQADIIQEIAPDDAADLLAKLSKSEREEILDEMDPEEAEDVRQLLEYQPNTAGGLMTTLPIILSANTTVATALALIRNEEIAPALASAVFVTLSPLETPTGKFLGMVHFQQLLRTPPTALLKDILDVDVPTIDAQAPLEQVMRELATYDYLTLPVINKKGQLLGVISIDDVLDHALPDNWREVDDD